ALTPGSRVVAYAGRCGWQTHAESVVDVAGVEPRREDVGQPEVVGLRAVPVEPQRTAEPVVDHRKAIAHRDGPPVVDQNRIPCRIERAADRTVLGSQSVVAQAIVAQV